MRSMRRRRATSPGTCSLKVSVEKSELRGQKSERADRNQGLLTSSATRSSWIFPLDPGRGIVGQLGSAVQAELFLYLLTVVLDRFDADVDLAGHFFRLFPSPDELKYFHFAIAKALDGRFLNVFLTAHL